MRIRLAKTLEKSFAKKNLTILSVLILGAALSIDLSLVPAPLLHFVLGKDILSGFETVLRISGAGALLSSAAFGAKRFFSLSRKRACKILFIGASIASFASGLFTFVKYPEILASGGYGWLIGGTDLIFFGTVTLSAVVFFVAAILWDILLGSLFAALQSFLT